MTIIPYYLSELSEEALTSLENISNNEYSNTIEDFIAMAAKRYEGIENISTVEMKSLLLNFRFNLKLERLSRSGIIILDRNIYILERNNLDVDLNIKIIA